MQRVFIYMIGTAGSGKTHLTKAFSEWLDLKKLDNITVNLDPGAENLPYSPDIDIRDWITLDDIITRYGVGPNGAQIIGADLVGAEIDEIKDEVDYHDVPYVIVDTPGQMELFTLRRSGEIVMNVLGRNESVMVFLFDPVISKTPSGYLSVLFMATSAVFRLGIPQIPVLSKCDVLGEKELEKIMSWSDPDQLYLDMQEKGITGDLFHVMRESGFFRPLIPVSATTGYGMDDIYDCIQEVFYGGEDLERILY